MHRPTPAASLIATLATALAASGFSISLGGCAEQPPAAAAPDPSDPATYADGQSYTVRGVITQLPDAGPPPEELKIHHEHIPTFADASGEVFDSNGVPGMRAMNMGFPNLAPSVPLDDFEVGDKVEFDFLVRWTDAGGGQFSASWLISRLEKLPAETEISHENRIPAEDPVVP